MRWDRFACVVLAGAAFGTMAAAPGHAGSRLVTETRKVGDESGRVERATLTVDGDRLRLDAAGGETAVIYRADRQEIWMIDHKDKTFVKLNQQTTQNLAKQVDVLRNEMDARLKNLPPEQRAAVEKLMGGKIAPAAEAEAQIDVRKLEGGDVVSGVVCHDVEILRKGEKIAQACRASYGAAGVDEADLQVVMRLASFLESSVSSLLPAEARRQTVDMFGSIEGLDGVPMRVQTFSSDGWPDRETIVAEIDSASIGDEAFQIPDGYRPRININVREGFGGP